VGKGVFDLQLPKFAKARPRSTLFIYSMQKKKVQERELRWPCTFAV
jgi:hypothetical protein